MVSRQCLDELRSAWLPHITDGGLHRLIELIETGSPLLVHGCFTRVIPMGCLATHAAWHHPRTAHLTQEAGIRWLSSVAQLNPATSTVLREWDQCGPHDVELRAELLKLFREERAQRETNPEIPVPVAETVDA